MINFIRPILAGILITCLKNSGFAIGLVQRPGMAQMCAGASSSSLCQQVSGRNLFDPKFQLFQPLLGGEVRVDVSKPVPIFLYDQPPLTGAVNVVDMWLWSQYPRAFFGDHLWLVRICFILINHIPSSFADSDFQWLRSVFVVLW